MEVSGFLHSKNPTVWNRINGQAFAFTNCVCVT